MDTGYILSIYNFFFEDSKGNHILYNTRTNSLLKIPEKLYTILNNTPLSKWPPLDLNVTNLLLHHKVLVKPEEDQTYFRCKKMEVNSYSYSSQTLSLTVLPTMNCNFCCGYCFEKHKEKIYMSDETIENLINFINTYPKDTFLQLTWFGGEPLLAQKQIKKILYRIKNETHVKLNHHSIITNGYCLDKNILQLFKEYPLNSIQVTIDGNKEHHDKVRILKNGQGTFDVITQNLKKALEELPDCTILVRVNINKKNKNDFYSVWDYFQKYFKNYQNRIQVYPGIIKVLDNKNKCWTCDTLLAKERSEFFYELDEKTDATVYYYPSIKSKGCIATLLNGFVIGAKGEIYKCWNEVGNKEREIGNIHNISSINTDKYSQYMVSGNCMEEKLCEKCSILPICSGGCPNERISNIFKGTHFELCSIYKDPKILAKSLELHYMRKKKDLQ